jgi:DNA polymerase-3 subunit epsilon
LKAHVEGCGCFPTGRHYAGIAHLIRIQAIGVVEGFEGEHAWLDLPIALIDVETTGRDSAVDRVVEIGIVLGRGGAVVERRSWLINPGIPIPEEARAVHGISDEMVQNEPAFAAIAAEIAEALRGVVPAAYNASFDKSFVLGELDRAGFSREQLPPSLAPNVEWLDPLVWARELSALDKSKSLGEVCERLGVTLQTAHRATDDAEAALHVLYIFSKDVRVPKSYAGFAQEQRRIMRVQDQERSFWQKG